MEKHIADIYPAELRLNKANTSDKETPFLDLNIKVIGSAIHTNVSLSSMPPGWMIMFLDSHRTVFTFYSWLHLLGVVLAFWISILKIVNLLQNYWHRVTELRKTRVPKGHITCTWVQCATFMTIGPDGHFCLLIDPKTQNW